jgi:hypothetical protein
MQQGWSGVTSRSTRYAAVVVTSGLKALAALSVHEPGRAAQRHVSNAASVAAAMLMLPLAHPGLPFALAWSSNLAADSESKEVIASARGVPHRLVQCMQSKDEVLSLRCVTCLFPVPSLAGMLSRVQAPHCCDVHPLAAQVDTQIAGAGTSISAYTNDAQLN